MVKLDWQWPAAVVFAVVFAVVGFLVYTGKLHAEVLLAAITWLAPAPYQARPTTPPPSQSRETH